MSYEIVCSSCRKKTWAANIVDLIDNHTDSSCGDDGGMLVCGQCGAPGHIYKSSKLQERGKKYNRYIRGVVKFRTSEPTYSPYVFLNSGTVDGQTDHVHFNYYKDTRESGGKLKHGHGPGGAPAFWRDTILSLIERLVQFGFLTPNDLTRAVKSSLPIEK